MAADAISQFAVLLRGYRLAAGLTQEALAERAGLSANGIQKLERGVTRPQRDTLERLLQALYLEGAAERAFRSAAAPVPRSRPAPSPALPTGRPRSHLPIALTSFIGREREVAAVRRLLDQARLVTLTGPGGVGKTRLALHVAAIAESFVDGVVVVALDSLTAPEQVLPAIAEALGVAQETDAPLAERLMDVLQGRRLLLVLDNFEHVLTAALVVAELLGACPRLVVLATSRAPLRLSGEQEYPVVPMPLPPAGTAWQQLMRWDAVQLFAERARARLPDFMLSEANAEDVAATCRLVDGLPLAVELAAARCKLLPPAALRALLEQRPNQLENGPRDAPARHRTLRATVAWSYDLLTRPERALFRRLAIFSGGATPTMVGAVCADAPTVDTLGGLATLLDHSLIFRLADEGAGADRVRVGMLETVRAYSEEQLREAGEQNAYRDRHAAYFAALTASAVPALQGQEQLHWLDLLTVERGNILAALRWSIGRGANEQALCLSAAMGWFWLLRGQLREGRDCLAEVLAATPLRDDPSRERGEVLAIAALLALHDQDIDTGTDLAKQALRLAEQVADARTLALARLVCAIAAFHVQDWTSAEQHAQACLVAVALSERLPLVATALVLLAHNALAHKEYGRARQILEEALILARRQGERMTLAVVLESYALALNATLEPFPLAALAEESLTARRQLGDPLGLADALRLWGQLALNHQELAAASNHFAESLLLSEQAGSSRRAAGAKLGLGEVARIREDGAEARRRSTELDVAAYDSVRP